MTRPGLVAALAIAALTLLVYLPVSRAAFIQLDDPVYVTENPHVLAGLTSTGFAWAMTTGTSANWHPLTWLSHMLDVELFGLDAGKHHVTNLLFHVANALLLFAILRAMTGAIGRSAFVAALFAVHPLHVETVAWVAERKDLLSAFFFLLAIGAYIRYVRAPSRVRYVTVLVVFVAGLMAKPMVVTLPFVLLLLDWWPLQRTGHLFSNASGAPPPLARAPAFEDSLSSRGPRRSRARQASKPSSLQAFTPSRLLREKLPFFVLAAASSIVTYAVQQKGGAVGALASYPLGLRMENAIVSYVAYVGQMFWPSRLIMLYPFPASVPASQVLIGVAVLVVVTLLAVRFARSRPYVAVGWFWYVVMLVPVIGFVQVGLQARADRYTYLPLTGLFIAITWAAWDVIARSAVAKRAAPALAIAIVLACSVVTRAQVAYWKDNVALWGHAIEVGLETDKYLAHNSLGVVLRDQGRVDEAIANFSEAVRLNPNYLEGHRNLGAALFNNGRMKDAITEFTEALRLDPALADVHNNLGSALANENRMAEAVPHFEEAIRLKPEFAEAYDNLGLARAQQNALTDAVASFTRAVQLKPDLESAHVHLGTVYAALGKIDDAIVEFTSVLRLNPKNDLAKSALDVLRQRRGRTGSL